jgi:hypothetical protein
MNPKLFSSPPPPSCRHFRSWLASTTVFNGNATRIMDADVGTRYLYSLYWATAIIQTIGYGDILPVQPFTVLMVLFVMLTGVFVFAYLLGNVASIVALFDGLEAESTAKREEARKRTAGQLCFGPL